MSNYETLSDISLTSLLKDGDDSAFTEIYRRYSKKLFIMCYNYCKNKETAEELVQEVFVGLWDKRDLLNVQKLQPYLATAIRFSVFKAIYKERRRQEIINQNITIDHAHFEEKLHAKFLQELINESVEQLPEKCNLVYRYSREEGLNNREISEKMKISEKTVEAHLTKALKSVRRYLNDNGTLILLASSALEKIIK